MNITFDSNLCIESIKFSNNTLTLCIVYKSEEENFTDDFLHDKSNRILFKSNDDYKGIEISEAEITFENISEIWWDDWWDEDAVVALWSVKLDNVHWRHDELGNLQYNVPKHDVDVNDINDLNAAAWETALSWNTFIDVDSDDTLSSSYHLSLNIPHDLVINKNRSRQYGPLHVKGKNIKIETKLECS